MGRYTSGSTGRDLLAGAVAGIAAIWIADKLDQAMYRKGGADRIRKTEAARPGGMDPAHVLAKRAADAVGADLGDPKNNSAGRSIHYGIAAATGALYGLLRGLSPTVTTGRGAMFGLAMFVLQDEVGNTVLGTAGNPFKYPLLDHARGAAAHTLFGVMTDMGTRLMSPWRDEVVIEQGMTFAERMERGRHYIDQGRGYLAEQGRQNLDQGRDYMERGIGYAGQLAKQTRLRLPEVNAQVAQRGRDYAGQIADRVRAQASDAADAAQASRARAGRYASNVRSQLPDVEDVSSGLSRAMTRLFG